ncbi:MAG: spore coat protein [Peptococcaceae bacterium]|nr:spore coat protein [Peptococcaceae bacterium]
MQLSPKEQNFLNDAKSQEILCIKKYNNYANQAQDPELKQIFQKLAGKEQEHLNSINQILAGQVPAMNQQNQQNQNQQQQQTQRQASWQGQTGFVNQQDADLCHDILSTEKFASQAYDTAIFEFKDANIRQVLNHIQKEEQEHGEEIFNYMQSKGMYKVQ